MEAKLFLKDYIQDMHYQVVCFKKKMQLYM